MGFNIAHEDVQNDCDLGSMIKCLILLCHIIRAVEQPAGVLPGVVTPGKP